MRHLVPPALSLVLLAACVSPSPPIPLTLAVQGWVQDSDERFWGTATGYPSGSGHLQIESNKGALCSGSFVYATLRRGQGIFHCQDGRTGPFSFTSSGYSGVGQGLLGRETFIFSFG